jgi:hypothetical protein
MYQNCKNKENKVLIAIYVESMLICGGCSVGRSAGKTELR